MCKCATLYVCDYWLYRKPIHLLQFRYDGLLYCHSDGLRQNVGWISSAQNISFGQRIYSVLKFGCAQWLILIRQHSLSRCDVIHLIIITSHRITKCFLGQIGCQTANLFRWTTSTAFTESSQIRDDRARQLIFEIACSFNENALIVIQHCGNFILETWAADSSHCRTEGLGHFMSVESSDRGYWSALSYLSSQKCSQHIICSDCHFGQNTVS